MPEACDTDEAKRAVLMKATVAIHDDFRKLVEADALHPNKQMHVSARFLEAAETFSGTAREAMPDFLSEECRAQIEAQLKARCGGDRRGGHSSRSIGGGHAASRGG